MLQYLLKITESSVAITLCQQQSTTPALPKKLRDQKTVGDGKILIAYLNSA